jgi:hypothetical protein
MAFFKLLAGQHQQADPDWEPSEEEQEAARTKGIVLKAPTRTYRVGERVESEVDLVKRHGAEKFERIGERRGVPRQQARRPVEEDLDPLGKKVPARGGVPAGVQSRTPGDPTEEMQEKHPSLGASGQVAQGFQEAVNQPTTNVTGGAYVPPEEEEEEGEIASPTPMKAGRTPAEAVEEQEALPENFDRMTLRDLKEYAEQEEIDLAGATRRDDVLKKIRAARE